MKQQPEARICCKCQQASDRWEPWSYTRFYRGTDTRVICQSCFRTLISSVKRGMAAVPEALRGE